MGQNESIFYGDGLRRGFKRDPKIDYWGVRTVLKELLLPQPHRQTAARQGSKDKKSSEDTFLYLLRTRSQGDSQAEDRVEVKS